MCMCMWVTGSLLVLGADSPTSLHDVRAAQLAHTARLADTACVRASRADVERRKIESYFHEHQISEKMNTMLNEMLLEWLIYRSIEHNAVTIKEH